LEPLLELADRDEKEGIGDAPWPPHFPKAEGEPPRVQPSKRRKPPAAGGSTTDSKRGSATGRRKSSKPLVEIARSETKDEAMAGLERWKARHPEAAQHLRESDVLVDSMRGRHTTWTRIRVNLEKVPEADRPEQEPLEVDYDPWEGLTWDGDTGKG
ncbi:MAG: DNA primase, partial [Actinomycetota bacterium]